MHRNENCECVLGVNTLPTICKLPPVVEVRDDAIKDEDRDKPRARKANVPDRGSRAENTLNVFHENSFQRAMNEATLLRWLI